MMKAIKIVHLGFLLSLCTWGFAYPAPSLEQADQAFAQFRYDDAILGYSKLLKKKYSETLVVKTGDAYFFKGLVAPDDEQEALYLKAKDVFQKGLDRYKNSADILARMGRVIGQLALFKGGKEKIRIGLQVEDYAKRALKIQPKNAIANAVFGIYQYELVALSGFERLVGGMLFGEIPKGDIQLAKTHLQTAVKYAPKDIHFRYMLAKTLFELQEYEKAQSLIDTLMGMPNQVAYDKVSKKNAKKLLSKIYRKQRKSLRF